MGDITTFESRKGYVNYSPSVIYRFVADLRNFERFIPENTVTEMVADRDNCSFRVNMLGKVNVAVRERKEFVLVRYEGDLLQTNTFIFSLSLNQDSENLTGIQIRVDADMNPMLKMMAADPVKRLLETLISEMEKFRGWTDLRE